MGGGGRAGGGKRVSPQPARSPPSIDQSHALTPPSTPFQTRHINTNQTKLTQVLRSIQFHKQRFEANIEDEFSKAREIPAGADASAAAREVRSSSSSVVCLSVCRGVRVCLTLCVSSGRIDTTKKG